MLQQQATGVRKTTKQHLTYPHGHTTPTGSKAHGVLAQPRPTPHKSHAASIAAPHARRPQAQVIASDYQVLEVSPGQLPLPRKPPSGPGAVARQAARPALHY